MGINASECISRNVEQDCCMEPTDPAQRLGAACEKLASTQEIMNILSDK